MLRWDKPVPPGPRTCCSPYLESASPDTGTTTFLIPSNLCLHIAITRSSFLATLLRITIFPGFIFFPQYLSLSTVYIIYIFVLFTVSPSSSTHPSAPPKMLAPGQKQNFVFLFCHQHWEQCRMQSWYSVLVEWMYEQMKPEEQSIYTPQRKPCTSKLRVWLQGHLKMVAERDRNREEHRTDWLWL